MHAPEWWRWWWWWSIAIKPSGEQNSCSVGNQSDSLILSVAHPNNSEWSNCDRTWLRTEPNMNEWSFCRQSACVPSICRRPRFCVLGIGCVVRLCGTDEWWRRAEALMKRSSGFLSLGARLKSSGAPWFWPCVARQWRPHAVFYLGRWAGFETRPSVAPPWISEHKKTESHHMNRPVLHHPHASSYLYTNNSHWMIMFNIIDCGLFMCCAWNIALFIHNI